MSIAIPLVGRHEKKEKPPLPPPLVSPLKHPVRWLVQKAEAGIDALVLAKLGTLFIVAAYYLLLGADSMVHAFGLTFHWSPLNQPWHDAISNPALRHSVRGVGEGLLGGSLAQLFIFNPYKHIVAGQKKRNILDRIEIALRIPNLKDSRPLRGWQFLLGPIYVLIYAIPGFAAGYYLLTWYGVDLNVENWQKVVGLFASVFLGRRPIKKIANDAQTWFAVRRCKKDKPIRRWHTPQFEARYNEVRDDGLATAVSQSGWVAWVLALSIPFVLIGAAYGQYVLSYIAR